MTPPSRNQAAEHLANLNDLLNQVGLLMRSAQSIANLLFERAANTEAPVVRRGRPPKASQEAAEVADSYAPVKPKRRTLSVAGRANIVAATKRRWAEARKQGKTVTGLPLKSAGTAKRPSAAARKRTSDAKGAAMRRRWAEARKRGMNINGQPLNRAGKTNGLAASA